MATKSAKNFQDYVLDSGLPLTSFTGLINSNSRGVSGFMTVIGKTKLTRRFTVFEVSPP